MTRHRSGTAAHRSAKSWHRSRPSARHRLDLAKGRSIAAPRHRQQGSPATRRSAPWPVAAAALVAVGCLAWAWLTSTADNRTRESAEDRLVEPIAELTSPTLLAGLAI